LEQIIGFYPIAVKQNIS